MPKYRGKVKTLAEDGIDAESYDPMAELLKYRNLLVEELELTCNGGHIATPDVSDISRSASSGRIRYTNRDHSAKLIAEIVAVDRELMPYKYPKLRSQETKVEAGSSITDLLRELNGGKSKS